MTSFFKKFSYNQILLFLLLASVIALSGAYIAQYIFHYQPCILCLYQRKPFFIIIAASLISIAFARHNKSKKIAIIFCMIMLLINSGIAAYHVGVEQKIFKGSNMCSAENLNSAQSLEELEIAMANAPSVKCDDPQLFFLNFSMAAWNVVFCIVLFLISLIYYRIVNANIVPKRSR